MRMASPALCKGLWKALGVSAPSSPRATDVSDVDAPGAPRKPEGVVRVAHNGYNTLRCRSPPGLPTGARPNAPKKSKKAGEAEEAAVDADYIEV